MTRTLIYLNAPDESFNFVMPQGWTSGYQNDESKEGLVALVSWHQKDEVSVTMLDDAVASHRASGAELTVPDPAYVPADTFILIEKGNYTGIPPVLEELNDIRVNRYVPSLELVKNTPALRQAVVGKQRGLVLALTETCNMFCRMCPFYGCDIPDGQKGYYRDYMRRRGGYGHSSLKDFMVWVDTFRPYLNMKAVSVYGPGEPFLHPDAGQTIQACNEYGLIMNFATNGNRFSQAQLDTLKKGHIGTIIFSLDALTRETYKQIKPLGDFSRVLDAIEQLLYARDQGADLRISISFIRQECNAHEEKDFVTYWGKRADNVVVTSKYYGGIPESMPSFTPHAPLPCPHLENSVHILSNGDCWSCSAGVPDEFLLGNVNEDGPRAILETLDQYIDTRINTGEAGPLCRDCRWWSQAQRIETWRDGKIIRVDQPFSYRVIGRSR